MAIEESRITCPICNGTGDIPQRVDGDLSIKARSYWTAQIQVLTLLGIVKEISKAKSIERAREIAQKAEAIVWGID